MTSRKGAREGACPRSGLPHGLAPLCRVGGSAAGASLSPSLSHTLSLSWIGLDAGFRAADLRARVRVNPTSLGSPHHHLSLALLHQIWRQGCSDLQRWRTRGDRTLSAHPRLHVDRQRQHLAADERMRVDAPLYDILLK